MQWDPLLQPKDSSKKFSLFILSNTLFGISPYFGYVATYVYQSHLPSLCQLQQDSLGSNVL